MTISDGQKLQRHIRYVFLAFTVVIGGIHAYAARNNMNPDGISYLDIAEAYIRGEWDLAINAWWSPLYSWILGLALSLFHPSAYWEFPLVHAVNFVIYIAAFGSFSFFLHEFIRALHKNGQEAHANNKPTPLPAWTLALIGYTLFLIASLNLITISLVTPDMLVSVFVYFAAGLIVRMRRTGASWTSFILLGIVLGFGYLAKAPIFPLAFVFFASSILVVGSFRKALPKVSISVFFFLLIAAPFVFFLSEVKGKPTFGESGRINYAWYLNGPAEHIHWQGGPEGRGVPTHPTRKIFDSPAVYEFGSPIGGTYPPWYDPSYWHEGITPYFDFNAQLWTLYKSFNAYYDIFSRAHTVLFLGFIFFLIVGGVRPFLKNAKDQVVILLTALSALGMFALVLVKDMYVAPFIVLLWLGVFAAVRAYDSVLSRNIVKGLVVAMVVVMMAAVFISSVPDALTAVRDIVKSRDAFRHIHWYVAQGLDQRNIQAGDKVSVISHHVNGLTAYWARLAKVQIVSEIPSEEERTFWASDDARRNQILNLFVKTGARAVIAENVPDPYTRPEWKNIDGTSYYIYLLSTEKD